MTVGILGGASGVGSELVTILQNRGEEVVVLDRVAPKRDGVDYIHVDLMEPASVRRAASLVPQSLKAMALVAGGVHRDEPGDVLQANYVGVRLFIDALSSTTDLAVIASASSISASAVGTDPDILNRLLSLRMPHDWQAVGRRLSTWDEYRLSKWLIEQWTLAMAAGFGGKSIDVRANVVSAGAIDTPLLSAITAVAPDKMLGRAKRVLGRNARPAEVAHVFSFLLGEESSWVNGTVLRVDGGLMNIYAHRRGGAV